MLASAAAAVRGEDPHDPVTVQRGAAERRQRGWLVQLGERQERPLPHLARLVGGREEDRDGFVASVAQPARHVGERLGGVCALVRLLVRIGEDRDDPAHRPRVLETLDTGLQERWCAHTHVTFLSDGRRAAQRM